MQRTHTPTHTKIERDWHLMDANGKVLGRLATEIAQLLIGKHKANFTPNMNTGDKVVVLNAEKIEVTGKKMTDKVYHRYTGYPGGIKSESLEKLLARKPTEVIKKAVYGMLPKNKLRKQRMSNLYIYAGEKHPHEAQLGEKK